MQRKHAHKKRGPSAPWFRVKSSVFVIELGGTAEAVPFRTTRPPGFQDDVQQLQEVWVRDEDHWNRAPNSAIMPGCDAPERQP